MSAIGTFIEFIELKEKSLFTTNKDLKHGKIISIGKKADIDIKAGDKAVISCVKIIQDLIEGETHYFVDQNSVIKKLS